MRGGVRKDRKMKEERKRLRKTQRQTGSKRGKNREGLRGKKTCRSRKKKDTCSWNRRERIFLQQESTEQLLCEGSVLAGPGTEDKSIT